MSRSLFVFVILISSLSLAHGQGGVGSTRGLPEAGGTNVIQGKVYFPEGPVGTQRVRITLESTDEMTKSTQTDQDGAFRFNGLKPGSYTVVVDGGKEYETARESVFFEGGRHNTVVPIYLRAKGSGSAMAGIPKGAVDLYKKGQQAAQKGDHKQAAEFLSQAVNLHPDFPQALNDLGLEYLKLGQVENAAQTYEALLKIRPADPTAHLNFGIALYNVSLKLLGEKKTEESNQKLAQTENELRQALKLNVPGPNAHYYLGLVLIRLKNYAEAQKELEFAVANGGEGLALAHKYLGGLYMSAKRHKEAADHLAKYLELDPKAKDAEQIRGTIKELREKP